jgi:hypothetical protein
MKKKGVNVIPFSISRPLIKEIEGKKNANPNTFHLFGRRWEMGKEKNGERIFLRPFTNLSILERK